MGRSAPAPKAATPPKAVETVNALKDALPDVTKFGTDLGGAYTSLTDLLTGIKDGPTSEAALPKITDLTAKLDGFKEIWGKLNDAGKATVSKVTADHLSGLKDLIAKVLAIAGVSEKLKPALETVLTKLAEFAAK